MTIETEVYLMSQFRVEPNMVQVCVEEGYYYTQRGFVIQGLSEGVHCYEFQRVFQTEQLALDKVDQLERLVNATKVDGLKVTEDWNYIGSST
jgi:hypothetical protein